MTDQKKVEPMTIDELIEEIKALYDAIGESNSGSNYAASYVRGVNDARDCITNNRDALEARLRGVLRFRIYRSPFGNNDAYLLNSDGEYSDYLGIKRPFSVKGGDIEELKKELKAFAQSLNIEVEFVGDPEVRDGK